MVNFLPIIGILCYDIDFDIRHHFGEQTTYYISSAYVKWLESSGAKVVPIWANRTDDYYRDIMNNINGILLPGGQFWLNDDNGQAAYSARKIYDIAIVMNDKGIYFPIWGTCLGQQLLFYAASGGETNSRTLIQPINENSPLKFENNYRLSKMFKNVPDDILKLMKNEPVMFNNHKYVVTKKIMKNYGMVDDWNIIATNSDSKNEEFITTSEHAKYPFYGVISHPESIQFEDYPETIPHTLDAIKVSQYFSNFFVEETRKNNNTFDEGDELRHLIYNFPVTFIQPKLSKFRECYLFTDQSDYPKKSDTKLVKQ